MKPVMTELDRLIDKIQELGRELREVIPLLKVVREIGSELASVAPDERQAGHGAG
jgi:hypothetical protein